MTKNLDAPHLVLIVDDSPENLRVLSAFLDDESLELAIAKSGEEALAIAIQEPPDLILLDIMMPLMDGFEVCERLKNIPATQDVPIIFLTGRNETADMVRGFACGAVDYITKPFNMEELSARVFTHLELKRARDTNEIQNRQLGEANRELRRLSALQKQAFSTALQESEELHRLTLSSISEAVFITDDCGAFTFVCPNVEAIFGYSFEEVQALGNIEGLLGEHIFAFDELLARQEIPNIERKVVDRFGQPHVLLVTVKQVSIGAGTLVYSCRDISRRTQAEDALRSSEQQYRMLAESVADGIGIIQNEKWVFVNEALARMLGDTAETLLGEIPEDFLLDEQKKQLYKKLEQEASDAQSWPVLKYVAGGDENGIWMEGRQRLIRWQGEPAILIDMRDITRQKLREIEIQEEREQLRRENLQLRSTMKDRYQFGSLIGKSLAMQEVYEMILKAAATDKDVLIYGESGTGKELVAKTIHDLSKGERRNFVPVNCGAVPEALFEREFFGHHKGAFTGADRDKPGFFGSAHHGTLFLDEIGELSPALQVKLLRAVESGEYTSLGDNRPKTADVRIVAATHRNLKELVQQGLMREDFFYRIHVLVIAIPPLRTRKEDIPLLVEHFLKQYSENAAPAQIPARVLEAFYEYEWPGNIRQLQNTLSRYLTVGRLDFISPHRAEDLAGVEKTPLPASSQASSLHEALDTLERQLILKSLEQEHWHRKHAADALGIPRKTLFRKMKKYGLA